MAQVFGTNPNYSRFCNGETHLSDTIKATDRQQNEAAKISEVSHTVANFIMKYIKQHCGKYQQDQQQLGYQPQVVQNRIPIPTDDPRRREHSTPGLADLLENLLKSRSQKPTSPWDHLIQTNNPQYQHPGSGQIENYLHSQFVPQQGIGAQNYVQLQHQPGYYRQPPNYPPNAPIIEISNESKSSGEDQPATSDDPLRRASPSPHSRPKYPKNLYIKDPGTHVPTFFLHQNRRTIPQSSRGFLGLPNLHNPKLEGHHSPTTIIYLPSAPVKHKKLNSDEASTKRLSSMDEYQQKWIKHLISQGLDPLLFQDNSEIQISPQTSRNGDKILRYIFAKVSASTDPDRQKILDALSECMVTATLFRNSNRMLRIIRDQLIHLLGTIDENSTQKSIIEDGIEYFRNEYNRIRFQKTIVDWKKFIFQYPFRNQQNNEVKSRLVHHLQELSTIPRGIRGAEQITLNEILKKLEEEMGRNTSQEVDEELSQFEEYLRKEVEKLKFYLNAIYDQEEQNRRREYAESKFDSLEDFIHSTKFDLPASSTPYFVDDTSFEGSSNSDHSSIPFELTPESSNPDDSYPGTSTKPHTNIQVKITPGGSWDRKNCITESTTTTDSAGEIDPNHMIMNDPYEISTTDLGSGFGGDEIQDESVFSPEIQQNFRKTYSEPTDFDSNPNLEDSSESEPNSFEYVDPHSIFYEPIQPNEPTLLGLIQKHYPQIGNMYINFGPAMYLQEETCNEECQLMKTKFLNLQDKYNNDVFEYLTLPSEAPAPQSPQLSHPEQSSEVMNNEAPDRRDSEEEPAKQVPVVIKEEVGTTTPVPNTNISFTSENPPTVDDDDFYDYFGDESNSIEDSTKVVTNESTTTTKDVSTETETTTMPTTTTTMPTTTTTTTPEVTSPETTESMPETTTTEIVETTTSPTIPEVNPTTVQNDLDHTSGSVAAATPATNSSQMNNRRAADEDSINFTLNPQSDYFIIKGTELIKQELNKNNNIPFRTLSKKLALEIFGKKPEDMSPLDEERYYNLLEIAQNFRKQLLHGQNFEQFYANPKFHQGVRILHLYGNTGEHIEGAVHKLMIATFNKPETEYTEEEKKIFSVLIHLAQYPNQLAHEFNQIQVQYEPNEDDIEQDERHQTGVILIKILTEKNPAESRLVIQLKLLKNVMKKSLKDFDSKEKQIYQKLLYLVAHPERLQAAFLTIVNQKFKKVVIAILKIPVASNEVDQNQMLQKLMQNLQGKITEETQDGTVIMEEITPELDYTEELQGFTEIYSETVGVGGVEAHEFTQREDGGVVHTAYTLSPVEFEHAHSTLNHFKQHKISEPDFVENLTVKHLSPEVSTESIDQ